MPSCARLQVAALRPFAFGILCAAWTSVASAALIIDDFDTGPISLTRSSFPAVTELQTALDPNHVIGGSRQISINGHFADFGQSLTVDATQGHLKAYGPNNGDIRVSYGAQAPLNLNLAALSGHFLRIEGIGNPLTLWPSMPYIIFTSQNGGSALYGVAGPAHTPIPGGAAFEIPLSSPGALQGNPDLTHITGIQIQYVEPTPERILTLVAIVPEPTSLVLLAAAAPLVWLGVSRRRKPLAPARANRRTINGALMHLPAPGAQAQARA
jgi:hypothetical protein